MPAQKEKPVKKEVPKETPVKEKVIEKKETIYKPVMPQPLVPEIDINNYYLTNMTEIETHTHTPPPPQPVHYHKESESSSSSESYKMPVQEECYEAMYPPFDPCPPVMPIPDCGCGGPVMHQHGFEPYPYGMAAPHPNVPYPMPYQQAPMMMPAQGFVPPQPVWQGQSPQMGPAQDWEDESSSSFPYHPVTSGGYPMQTPQMYPQPMPGMEDMPNMPGTQGMPGMQHGGAYGANPETLPYLPPYGMQQNVQSYVPYQNPYQPMPYQAPYGYGQQPFGGYGMQPYYGGHGGWSQYPTPSSPQQPYRDQNQAGKNPNPSGEDQ
jgi:morphogenetic protein associated with SpoVID